MDINRQTLHTTLPLRASCISEPEPGNATTELLILHIQKIVRNKDLEPGTSWDEKKKLLHEENKILTSNL